MTKLSTELKITFVDNFFDILFTLAQYYILLCFHCSTRFITKSQKLLHFNLNAQAEFILLNL